MNDKQKRHAPEFYTEKDESQYRLYRRVIGESDHFLGWFDSLEKAREEITLIKTSECENEAQS